MQNREFNLIDQAKYYLERTKELYKRIDRETMKEDYIIRDTCLRLQYTIEIYLKGLVEQLCGCDYKHTHELVDNINIIIANKDNIKEYEILKPILDSIDDYSILIKSFHTKAVYINGFTTTIREIDNILKIANDLDKYCDTIKL
jgi:hypothetical protein